MSISDEVIEKILATRYVIMEEAFLSGDPSLSDDGFETGYYFGNVICYDLALDRAFFEFSFYAENSDEVFIEEGYSALDPTMQLKMDLIENIEMERESAFFDHFDVMNW